MYHHLMPYHLCKQSKSRFFLPFHLINKKKNNKQHFNKAFYLTIDLLDIFAQHLAQNKYEIMQKC
ncbi:hypothetical protein BpHYR1_042196 [Brachionus plicatilis]|uniref:Uncharacterized protein n=1 Tax=Brachionus plicatilis TaxID=10195 RepID=A0A3M7SGH7_BRAPC|nr:hypothetical protein BpHYR1_042196 [Brachionus plicatilis]